MEITELADRVRVIEARLESGEMIRQVLEPRSDEIMTLQRQQLFYGQASDGEDIRPYYSEDIKPSGYFSSRAAAERYAAYKATEIAYPVIAERNPDAPNLYINGKFHSELGVRFTSTGVDISGTSVFARRVVSKYGKETFGLTADNWSDIFRQRGAKDDLIKEIKNILS